MSRYRCRDVRVSDCDVTLCHIKPLRFYLITTIPPLFPFHPSYQQRLEVSLRKRHSTGTDELVMKRADTAVAAAAAAAVTAVTAVTAAKR
mmetsp:Transcript_39380/g.80785  ORF Transcript_39380/g.80785 Transcript_39380/m.80785 type:complete len:90 (+) Transcript_39380:3300-3569(+)